MAEGNVIPYWTGHYIGLKHSEKGRDRSGIDAWGMIRLMMAEQLGIALPSFSTETTQSIANYLAKDFQAIKRKEVRLADIMAYRKSQHEIGFCFCLSESYLIHVPNYRTSVMAHIWPFEESCIGFFRYKRLNDHETEDYMF